MYSCPGCGSSMTFDIQSQQLKCGRCDRTESIAVADQREARHAGSSFSVDLLTCPTCGAAIRAMNTASAAFCSYCGSSVMLNQQSSEMDAPETVAPFRVTREACFEKYQQMLKKSLCVDHRLKRDVKAESFRGIYVPFHIYSGMVRGDATLEGHETHGDDTYYYNTRVELNHQYDDILHDASVEMPDTLSERVSQVPHEAFRPFSPAYLSGFYADMPDANPGAYLSYAKAAAVRTGLKEVIEDLQDGCTYSTAEAEKKLVKLANAKHTGETLVPVWFMSLRSGKRVLYAIQNGVTGEMAADVPLDIPRFALITLLLAIPLYFLFNMFLTLRPEMVLVIAMMLAVLAQLVVNGRRRVLRDRETAEETASSEEDDMDLRLRQRKRMERNSRESGFAAMLQGLGGLGGTLVGAAAMYGISRLDDIRIFKLIALGLTLVLGFLIVSGGKKQIRAPWGSFAALVTAVAGSAVLVLDPFHSADLPVYILSFLSMAAVIWESLDLLLLHNRECSNPLPQFETHQGGEDHA